MSTLEKSGMEHVSKAKQQLRYKMIYLINTLVSFFP